MIFTRAHPPPPPWVLVALETQLVKRREKAYPPSPSPVCVSDILWCMKERLVEMLLILKSKPKILAKMIGSCILPNDTFFPPNETCVSFEASENVSGNSPGNHSFPLSRTHTACPALAQRLAAIEPPYPEPMTITS